MNKSGMLLAWHQEMRILPLVERGLKLMLEAVKIKTLMMIKAKKQENPL